MNTTTPAEAIPEGRGAIAMCLDCEWVSPECRSVEQANVRAQYHNWRAHGAAKP